MTTLNISIPESMKAYVEAQAAEGDFTTSEYVRHLIRMDQERKTIEKRAQIAQYLALCEQQIARGEAREWDADKLRNEFEKEYKKSKQSKK
ncbi:MAG: type II toxin-antitoxin system ParD family antitoxin [Pseudomonadota bacterium]